MDYSLYTDGGITENPGGLGSWGWLLKRQPSGETTARGFGCLGRAPELTNNVCEYEAVFQGLVWFLMHVGIGRGRLLVRLDSQLIANQVTERWQCHSETLAASLARTRGVLRLFTEAPAFEWIPRTENAEADALCQLATERYRSRPAGSAYWQSECLRPVQQQSEWAPLPGPMGAMKDGALR